MLNSHVMPQLLLCGKSCSALVVLAFKLVSTWGMKLELQQVGKLFPANIAPATAFRLMSQHLLLVAKFFVPFQCCCRSILLVTDIAGVIEDRNPIDITADLFLRTCLSVIQAIRAKILDVIFKCEVNRWRLQCVGSKADRSIATVVVWLLWTSCTSQLGI